MLNQDEAINTEDAKLFDFTLASNRDFTRVNRACATLQANVMSLIGTESLKTIKDSLNTKKRKHDEENNTRLSTLVDLALDTATQSKDLFNKCQRTVSKVVAECYSSCQHNMMLRTTKYGEPIIHNQALSPCLANEDVSHMYHSLLGKTPKTRKNQVHLPVQSHPDESDSPSSEHLNADLKQYLKQYCNSRLPPVKRGRISYGNVPSSKDQLVLKCFKLKGVSLLPPLIVAPIYPSLLSVEHNDVVVLNG